MKIDRKNNKIIIYLYRYHLSFDDMSLLSDDIKNLFIKLIKVYHLELNGLLNVTIYENKYYGYVLELENIKKYEYESDILDLKISIFPDSEFFVKCREYDVLKKYHNLYYMNNEFYVNIRDIDNILDIIEYIDIVYSNIKSDVNVL